MNEEEKKNKNELETSVKQSEEKNNELADNTMSIYRKLLTRLCMVSTGMMVFAISFLKATKITGFDTTKLLLFEICLIILLVFAIGAVTSLVMMRNDNKSNRMVAAHIYVSALSSMVVLLLIWVFFKANSI